MGILQEMDRTERKLLMMAQKDIANPLGQLAVEVFAGEVPADLAFIKIMMQRGLLVEGDTVPCRDPDDRISGTRTFYRLTADGRKLAGELTQMLSRGAPDDLEGYRAWANRLFSRLLETAPAGVNVLPQLETAKEQLNLLPTRFEIVSKTNEHDETWSWDVVLRVARRN